MWMWYLVYRADCQIIPMHSAVQMPHHVTTEEAVVCNQLADKGFVLVGMWTRMPCMKFMSAPRHTCD